MEILEKALIDGKEIFIGQNWNIGENVTVVIKEIFSINEEVFIATTVSNHPHMIKIVKTNEVYESCRYISSAKKWVGENSNLFETE